jgi:hypothetical protein
MRVAMLLVPYVPSCRFGAAARRQRPRGFADTGPTPQDGAAIDADPAAGRSASEARRPGEDIAFTSDVMPVTRVRRSLFAAGAAIGMAVRVAAAARILLSSSGRLWCALRGHEMLLHFEPDRLSLRCAVCGAETPGWRLDVRPDLRHRPPRVWAPSRRRSRVAGAAPLRGPSAPASPSPVLKAA